MKIIDKNAWISKTGDAHPFRCTWSIHLENGYVLAGWREVSTGRGFVYLYGRYNLTADTQNSIVARLGGEWFICDCSDTQQAWDAPKVGPFPCRRAAIAAHRMMST